MEAARPLRRNLQADCESRPLRVIVGAISLENTQTLTMGQEPMHCFPGLAGLDVTLDHQGSGGHASRRAIPQAFHCVCHAEALL